MSRRERTVRVYEVLFDGEGAGPAGDGTHVARFTVQALANKFASENTAWGRPAKATAVDAPVSLARRWGIA